MSKSQSASSGATVVWTGTLPCTPAAVIAPSVATWQSNGAGHFITTIYACIVTSAVTAAPIATWTGAGATFTDIEVATYHTTNTWKTVFTDQETQNIATTSTTSCPTGTTTATTNANDLILATCQIFNNSQTWGTLAGFTNRTSLESGSVGWYDKTVSATGTQNATITLSAADFGLGMIVAFASN